jgi:lysophospholipase L1-like esterase
MHRIATIIAVAIAAVAATITVALPASASHRAAAPAPPKAYYLSLGDSLAQGIEPNAKGVDVETTQGYPNQLYTALHTGNPLLNLEKLGCPGETTTSMIKGGICTYSKGSQLAQAVAFLKAHEGHVQLVTIDIGANDLNPCVVLPTISKIVACLDKVFPPMLKNLATILATLRAADAKPVKIIGMTYYDPELAEYLEGTASGKQIAEASVTLAQTFGNDLTSIYKKYDVPVANVYRSFQTGELKPTTVLPAFGTVPRDVAYICSYTYECAAPPVGPNEHDNVLGYGVIANAFLNVYQG